MGDQPPFSQDHPGGEPNQLLEETGTGLGPELLNPNIAPREHVVSIYCKIDNKCESKFLYQSCNVIPVNF